MTSDGLTREVGELALIVDLERDTVRLEEGCVPPNMVEFCPDFVDQIREGKGWRATVETQRSAEVVVLHVCPVPLRYRLTGGVDALTGGLPAERVDEDGSLWEVSGDAVR